MTVGVAGVPGGSRLNISTPDNPRGRMSRQHGRRPSSYQRPYVYTSPCSTTLVSQERCSKTMGIVLPGVLRFWIHIYLDIYTRTCNIPLSLRIAIRRYTQKSTNNLFPPRNYGGLPYYIFLVSTSGEITFSGHE